MKLLEDRVIIVTGVGAGLGRAYSLDLSRHGALLVLNDIDEEGLAETDRQIRARGGRAVARVGSVCDWDHATSLVDTAVASSGRLDGIVNNAGIHYVVPSVHDTPERMRQVMETNVLGTQYTGTAAIRHMVASGRGGVVLNVSSGAASGMASIASYSASKGAVASLTWSWALELREDGVRVNAIDPAAYTVQVEHTMAVRPSPVTWSPDRIAPLATYLVSDLSASVTGQVVRRWGDDLHLMSHHGPMAPWLSDPGWTVEKLDRAFRTELSDHLQSYGRDMRKYVPFPGTAGPPGAEE
ncbi:MAG: SDR family NAD(P)-dependent oxidoreductase [Actinomycetota bacterium]|nr:SDR family NAD(P)-dependent oxidoreductase [Actinomycetota bacterium]